MASSKQQSGGMSFCGVLTLIFVVLKLVGAIAWSWWWVFSPLWIPITLLLALALLGAWAAG